MAKYKVLNIESKGVGEVELSDDVFSAKVSMPLIHEAVKFHRSNVHVGTASAKNRSDVKCSNVKPYRQKGTGRARHGSWVSPLFVGGGIVFGPQPRDFGLKLSRTKRKVALKSALSSKHVDKKIIILDKWVERKKTKEMSAIFKKLKVGNALIVLNEPTKWLERTVRNIPNINVAYAKNLDTYNILAHEYLIFEKDVVAKIEEGFKK